MSWRFTYFRARRVVRSSASPRCPRARGWVGEHRGRARGLFIASNVTRTGAIPRVAAFTPRVAGDNHGSGGCRITWHSVAVYTEGVCLVTGCNSSRCQSCCLAPPPFRLQLGGFTPRVARTAGLSCCPPGRSVPHHNFDRWLPRRWLQAVVMRPVLLQQSQQSC